MVGMHIGSTRGRTRTTCHIKVSPTPATDHIAVLQHIMSTLSTSATLLVAGAAAGAGLAVAYMNHRQQNPQLPHQLQVSPTPETDHIAVLLLTCGKDETEGLVAALGASLVSTDVSKSSNLHIFGQLYQKGKTKKTTHTRTISHTETHIVNDDKTGISRAGWEG